MQVTGHAYPGCGPAQAIDGSQGSGWSSNAGRKGRTDGTLGFQPKTMTVRLQKHLDVTGFAVDPSSTCGDDATSSTAGYRIQTSSGATGPWTTVASSTFTAADNGRMNQVDAVATDVEFVRFTILNDQVPSFSGTCGQGGGPSGCHYADMTELQIFGTLTP
jgi:hypothetical protein